MLKHHCVTISILCGWFSLVGCGENKPQDLARDDTGRQQLGRVTEKESMERSDPHNGAEQSRPGTHSETRNDPAPGKDPSRWPEVEPAGLHVAKLRVVLPKEYVSGESFPRKHAEEHIRKFYDAHDIQLVFGEIHDDAIEEDAALALNFEVKPPQFQYGHKQLTVSFRWYDPVGRHVIACGSVSGSDSYGESIEKMVDSLTPPLFTRDTRACVIRSMTLDRKGRSILARPVCTDDGRYIFRVATTYPKDSSDAKTYRLRTLNSRREESTLASRACIGPVLEIQGDVLCCFGEAGLEVYDLDTLPELSDPVTMFGGHKIRDVAFTGKHMVVVADEKVQVLPQAATSEDAVTFSDDTKASCVVTSPSGRLWTIRPVEKTEPAEGKEPEEKPREVTLARITKVGDVRVTGKTTLERLAGERALAVGERFAVIGSDDGIRVLDIQQDEPRTIEFLPDFPSKWSDEMAVVDDMFAVCSGGAVRVFRVQDSSKVVHICDVPQIPLGGEFNATGMYVALMLCDVGASRVRAVGNNLVALRLANKVTLHEEKKTSQAVWTQVIELPQLRAAARLSADAL